MRSQPSPAIGSSLYGADLREFIAGYEQYFGSAWKTCVYALTHGGRYPTDHAMESLAPFDRAVMSILEREPTIPVGTDADDLLEHRVVICMNDLGRLHLRPLTQERPRYGEEDRWINIGTVQLKPAHFASIERLVSEHEQKDALALARFRTAMAKVDAQGELPAVLDGVIDHVEHVESVCFFSRDRFFALIDRYVNLIDTKGKEGFLPRLRDKPLAEWTDEELTIVAGLHALFLSGRSVRFEEFNGLELDAQAIVAKLQSLYGMYGRVGVEEELAVDADLFDLARAIRRQTLQAVGKPWLRYRWIYGLNFQKKESVHPDQKSSESPEAYLAEFSSDHGQWVGAQAHESLPEHLFFTQLSTAALGRDIAGVPFDIEGSAASGWVEYLIERIVASAVVATQSDYGMSSSLRDISLLVQQDDARLSEVIHGFTPANFYTCFVTKNFSGRLDKPVADTVAASVQKRMMFNRWHFIPGNMERTEISDSRHWYYPPLIPDIAVHSDIHRAAHNRAMVKFSIRAPGPDMSRPPLSISGRPYRGFYDVRVVRMSGDRPFTPEEMLRTRRRTLWLESIYAVLIHHLQRYDVVPFQVRGFEAGQYADIAAI